MSGIMKAVGCRIEQACLEQVFTRQWPLAVYEELQSRSRLPLVLLFSPAVVLGFTPLFARVIK